MRLTVPQSLREQSGITAGEVAISLDGAVQGFTQLVSDIGGLASDEFGHAPQGVGYFPQITAFRSPRRRDPREASRLSGLGRPSRHRHLVARPRRAPWPAPRRHRRRQRRAERVLHPRTRGASGHRGPDRGSVPASAAAPETKRRSRVAPRRWPLWPRSTFPGLPRRSTGPTCRPNVSLNHFSIRPSPAGQSARRPDPWSGLASKRFSLSMASRRSSPRA